MEKNGSFEGFESWLGLNFSGLVILDWIPEGGQNGQSGFKYLRLLTTSHISWVSHRVYGGKTPNIWNLYQLSILTPFDLAPGPKKKDPELEVETRDLNLQTEEIVAVYKYWNQRSTSTRPEASWTQFKQRKEIRDIHKWRKIGQISLHFSFFRCNKLFINYYKLNKS